MPTYFRYGRVSREEQARKTHAFTQQLSYLEQQVQALGVDLTDSPLYSDRQSGREDDRPGLQQMLGELREGDWIIVTRIDRIARNAEFNAKLLKRFMFLDIHFFEIDRGRALDWKNNDDYESFLNAGVKAEMESRRLGARIQRGKAFARSCGKANSFPPYGYIRVNEKYEIDPSLHRFALRRLKILELAGSYTGAVRRIRAKPDIYGGGVSIEGLRRWFHNPVLRGHTGYGQDYASRHSKKKAGLPHSQSIRRKTDDTGVFSNYGEIRWDTHSGKNGTTDHRLLTEDRYLTLCRKLLYKGSVISEQQKKLTPLSGLLRCGACGGPMAVVRGKTQKKYYTCLNARQKLDVAHCTQRACIPLCDAEAIVSQELQQKAVQVAGLVSEELSSVEDSADPRLLELQRSLAQLNAMPQNPALEIAKDSIRQQIQAIKQESRPTVRAASREARELFNLVSVSFADPDYWQSLSQSELRQIFHGLINRVTVTAKPPGRFSSAKWDWVVTVDFAF